MNDLDLGATIKGFSAGQKVFSRYSLVRMLGRGGMGVVWLAKDEELGRETALKFLPEVVVADRAAIEDMKREVRRAIDLAHPHIVKIHDFITDGRTAAVSMEYIAGGTLSSLRIDQPGQVFDPAALTGWVGQLCEAIDYAHQVAEVVHRDLKPANLMVDAKGRLRVLDFGIAASISESVSRVSKQAGASGTPVYMSPQQMMGEDPAVTDDLYSIGATLFELLTGKPPFHAGNIMLQVQNKVAPPVNERRKLAGHAPVPPEWEQAIAACLAKDPAERPQSGAELLQNLGGSGGLASGPRPSVRARSAALSPAPTNERRIPLPGEDLHWARRWLLAPIVGALPTTLVMALCMDGMIRAGNPERHANVELFPFVWLVATIIGAGHFFVLIAIRRPWRFRGSWGIVLLGALTGGFTASVFALTHEVGDALSLGGTTLGAAVGAISGWWLYRVAARATFFPSGPIQGLRPWLVYCVQVVLVLGAAHFFSVPLPEAAKAAEDRRAERVRSAQIAEWTPKVDEAYRTVFDREPTTTERDKYFRRMENNTWWSVADLRREMLASEEGRNGGRLLVPQAYATISQALNAAQPGHVVLISSGTYQEQISLFSARITLRGVGRNQVIVQTEANTNTLNIGESAAGAKISGITFRHANKTGNERRYTPVWIGAADVEFTNNAIRDADGHGLTIKGAVNCRIHGNEISGSQWDGIAIYAGTSGAIADNTVRNNQQRGINIVEQPGTLLLRGNNLSFNGDAGLLAQKGDGVEIVDNTATNNGSKAANGGIAIYNRAGQPILRGNRAHDNKGPGIWWVDHLSDNPTPHIQAGNISDGREIPAGATKVPR